MVRGAHVTDSAVDIQRRDLKLTNLEKVLYPAPGFAEKDVIDYYARIAPAIIPHLAGRVLT
jgi:bifunctional non-homologous end joining protein LigD